MFVQPKIVKSDSIQKLDFDVMPIKEEFAEAVNFEISGGDVEDPTPFWVDIVDAEYYNGGEGIYVAVPRHWIVSKLAVLLHKSRNRRMPH